MPFYKGKKASKYVCVHAHTHIADKGRDIIECLTSSVQHGL